MAESKKTTLRSPAVRAKVFGVKVYRGFAKLGDLADISKADIYDQKKNPTGTQRDLSPAHARGAYEYVKNSDLGFWPEVFLCARKRDVVTFRPVSQDLPDLGTLEIDSKAVKDGAEIAISRVDGNHRLHYGDGKEIGYSRVEKLVSFCLAYDLSREEEIQLFKDINDNQKPMNTSHLDKIEVRLTPEEELKRRNPELYIAQRLNHDPESPFHGRIFEGGKKPVGVDIPLRGLKTGIEYMLSRSTQLPHLEDAEAQYRVIRNYFTAVKKWQPKPWSSPKEYIMLRGSGLWAICFIGAQVIDRALQQNEFKATQMLTILRSGKDWDWGKKGDFKGLGGRGGALEISNRVTRKLQDANRISTKQLFDKIMAEDSSD
ncbi:MAG: DGQHR domain-containing protein [Acidobacteria bacterium]|nr:DGQHR domain-containing protein [Acidobacteriota bacterium]